MSDAVIWKEKAETRALGSPSVSVVIVTYNGLRYLDACLSAVLNDVTKRTEVIVVDNASTDGSADEIAARFPSVRLVRNETNRGFAAACNQGARMAEGEVLVFLNQDTEVRPGWLSGLIAPLAEPDVGLTTSKVLQMDRPDRIHLCGQAVHYTGLVFGMGFGERADDATDASPVGAVGGASFAIGQELWEALGGFDEIFFMYYEETDLSWRAQLQGYRCVLVPSSVVLHDYREGGPSYNQLYHSMRNRTLMNLKNWRWLTLLLLTPALLLAEAIEWYLACAHGWRGLRAKVRAAGWLLSHPRTVLERRRRAQRTRCICDAEILRQRTYRLNPMTITGGRVGGYVTQLCNALFRANYRVAWAVCDALDL
ncbi:MAG: glycosyltransferase family 2 protein [Anaerolineae bacterium]